MIHLVLLVAEIVLFFISDDKWYIYKVKKNKVKSKNMIYKDL